MKTLFDFVIQEMGDDFPLCTVAVDNRPDTQERLNIAIQQEFGVPVLLPPVVQEAMQKPLWVEVEVRGETRTLLIQKVKTWRP